MAIINASIGFFQENKAEKALEDIKMLLSLKATVIRDGKRVDVDAGKITVGDIVLLSPGDKIPADLRLIETNNLKIEESLLTGESVPSEKNPDILSEDTMLGDRINMAFSGTTVSSGTGKGIVVEVGENTEIGKINSMISETEKMSTPLLKQTAKFGKTVSVVIVAIAIIIYVFGYFFRDYDSTELLMSVIGLAVAAIPEGLPAILSIIIGGGTLLMNIDLLNKGLSENVMKTITLQTIVITQLFHLFNSYTIYQLFEHTSNSINQTIIRTGPSFFILSTFMISKCLYKIYDIKINIRRIVYSVCNRGNSRFYRTVSHVYCCF